MFGLALLSIVHSLPLHDCSQARPCSITAYKDAEPGAGRVLDWYCQDHAYDGHNGTDFGIGGFVEMDRGRPVFASASGLVEATNDGAADRCTSGRCPGGGGLGNFVIIRHEDGSQSRFGHLRRGSVAVARGDAVNCATQIGQVGSSGFSTGPHLHFELRIDSAPVDPFGGDCNSSPGLWRNQGNYRQMPSDDCPDSAGLDDAQFVDENLPDGSAVLSASRVEKRWVLRNVGNSVWDESVQARLLSDEAWAAQRLLPLQGEVQPGETTTLSLYLEVPGEAGEWVYLRYRLERDGVPFGTTFWLDLVSYDAASDVGFQGDAGSAVVDTGIQPEPSNTSGCGCSQTRPQSLLLWLGLLILGCRKRSISKQ
ncbi:MAG: peptidoglycan DD-metalloendopeptidase family protein [Myxococcota bacterium]|nr:peptidoglycan DD-metalloendopeptidase family protein [Myxococcota bacterium]